MKNLQSITKVSFILLLAAFLYNCENDDSELKEATFSTNPFVFMDTFSGGLQYAVFTGAVPTAFQVDSEVTYNNTAASMRFDVPNVNDPAGSYAGGAFFTSVGRDLSGYNCITFWAKSTKAASLDVVGFGVDLGANAFQTSVSAFPLTTTWKKYIIPIPDPSKLKEEKGMFYISEGPEDGAGYSFWVDQVKFENLGTILQASPLIENGADIIEASFIGVNKNITGIQTVFNMPNGINQSVNASTNYFDFLTSDETVATVNSQGVITTVGTGTAVITAKLGDQTALGSVTIQSSGQFNGAPVPTRDPSTVISLFSDAYTNVPVDYYNGYWQPFQTTQSADFVANGDNVLQYTNFNFVGIQFSGPPVNASMMTHFHANIFIPGPVPAGSVFRVEIVNFGANGVFGGGDDSSHQTTFTTSTIVSQNWITLTIPFSAMTNLNGRTNLGQVIFSGTNITRFFADNIYFYNGGNVIPTTPTVAAPTPTVPAANVRSVFSNAYTNIAGTDLNPNWGQATQVSQVPIQGNNTLKYAGLNYQGLQFGSAQNLSTMNFLHLDYYTANSTQLRVYLISPGPVETPRTLTVPTTAGWNSIDIPLSQFSPVNLTNVIQMKFDGNGDIFLDNIYFKI